MPVEAPTVHIRHSDSKGSLDSNSSRKSAPLFATAGNRLAKGSSGAAKHAARGSIYVAKNVTKGSAKAAMHVSKGSAKAAAQMARKSAFVGKALGSALVQAAKDSKSIVNAAGTIASILVSGAKREPKDAGFVVFKSLYMAQTALQMVHHPKPYTMDVQEAPEPQDIFWRNVGMPHSAKRTGRGLAITASVVLCVFWSIPTAFVSSLTDVGSLKSTLPALKAFIIKHPGWEIILALIAPLLLNQLLLPSLLK
jgi:hypothetical protein